MSEEVAARDLPGGCRLSLRHGDLVREDVDAVVNAANDQLRHGGGVAAAIVRAGGRAIQEESDRIGHVPTGSAAITSGGDLPARHVIHAVGPVWHGGGRGEPELLASCVRESLRLAASRGLRSIAFPAISTGIFGYPREAGARVILGAIEAFAAANPAGSLRDVRITIIDGETVAAFRAAMEPAPAGPPSPRRAP